ncbi:hypothetical protein ADUPG1_011418, partial [Aduncisulcus paluster]
MKSGSAQDRIALLLDRLDVSPEDLQSILDLLDESEQDGADDSCMLVSNAIEPESPPSGSVSKTSGALSPIKMNLATREKVERVRRKLKEAKEKEDAVHIIGSKLHITPSDIQDFEERNKKRLAEIKQNHKDIRDKMIKEELKECTHQPSINKRSIQLTSCESGRVPLSERSTELWKEHNEKLKRMETKREEDELKLVTGKPQISTSSDGQSDRMSVFKKEYIESQIQQQKEKLTSAKKKRSEEEMKEATFRPMINPHSAELAKKVMKRTKIDYGMTSSTSADNDKKSRSKKSASPPISSAKPPVPILGSSRSLSSMSVYERLTKQKYLIEKRKE